MKKLFYVLLLPFLFSTCGKEQPSLIEMPYQVQFEIQAGLSPFENWYFVFEDIPNNKSTFFANAGITDADVTEIRGRTATLETIFSNAAYDFIYDISVRIYLDDPDDYRELFYRTEVPLNTSSTLGLLGGETDIQRFLTEDTFNLLIRIVPRETTPESIESRFDFVLNVR